jgi:hypothetical protein
VSMPLRFLGKRKLTSVVVLNRTAVKSRYHSQCRNRLITGRLSAKTRLSQKYMPQGCCKVLRSKYGSQIRTLLLSVAILAQTSSPPTMPPPSLCGLYSHNPNRPVADPKPRSNLPQTLALPLKLQNPFKADDLLWPTQLLSICPRIPNPGGYPFPD